MRVLVIHGPNLNLLGKREPEFYGSFSLDEINSMLRSWAKEKEVEIAIEQSNSEGRLIDLLHDRQDWADGIVINPAGLAHTSVCLADALRAIGVPAIEVHLSNIFSREPFRRTSLVAEACVGMIAGLGPYGYIAACTALYRRKAEDK